MKNGNNIAVLLVVLMQSVQLINTMEIEQTKVEDTYTLHGKIEAEDATSLAFSKDGSEIVIGTELWSTQDTKKLLTFTTPESIKFSVAFSPDDKAVLIGSDRGVAHLFEVKKEEPLKHFRTGCPITAVAFNSINGTIITVSTDNKVRVWDKESGTIAHCLDLPLDENTESALVSPDGKAILTGSKDATARLWDVKTSEQLKEFKGFTSSLSSAAFNLYGTALLTGSFDGTVRIWDTKTGEQLKQFKGHESAITSVAFSPDGKTILTGSDDSTARLWDIDSCKQLKKFKGSTEGVTAVAFSIQGDLIAIGYEDDTAFLWYRESDLNELEKNLKKS